MIYTTVIQNNVLFSMKKKSSINTIFTDIGGVLLTNGWDSGYRRKAIDVFKLDPEETEERHHLCFDTLEVGKITLDEYLDRVVFYKKRSFTPKKFWQFTCDQSQPLPGMIELIQQLKKKYRLKVAVVSNEGRELATYRINNKDFALKITPAGNVSIYGKIYNPDNE